MDNTFNIPTGWTAKLTHDGRVAIYSDDFAHDVKLVVFGDFRNEAERLTYATNLAARMSTPPVDAVPGEPVAPIDMVLHCPACGLQHIDAAEKPDPHPSSTGEDDHELWANPPHRSHLCHGCGHVWRPADVPTNGVAGVRTHGSKDSPLAASVASRAGSEPVGIVKHLEKIDVVWITHPSSMAENTHLYAIAPAAAAEPSEPKCDPTQTECRRCKNAMANCDGVFAPDRAGVASLVARMTRLKDAIEGECNGLAITDDVAKEIIAYIDTGLPPYLRSAAQAKP